MPINLDVVTMHQDIISFSLVFSFKMPFCFFDIKRPQVFVCVSLHSPGQTMGWVPLTMTQTPDEACDSVIRLPL